MKILSFHPFSLYANGGGSRILRRLYQGHEAEIISIAVEGSTKVPLKGDINEYVIYGFPVSRKWMRWHLRNWVIALREKKFVALTNKRVRKIAAQIPCDIIHVVNHGPFADALCTEEFKSKKLWVSFHDHYKSTNSSLRITNLLWNNADRRLVISDQLGQTYQTLFGNKPYELITDGVYKDEITYPATEFKRPFEVYFAGMLHIDYLPLFRTLADALDNLSKQGMSFKFILRATQKLPFLNNRLFDVEYRGLTLSNAELKTELDSATVLYLPMKFTDPDFYLYSLSTKMVGYLGAPGTILYHGPADSAACHMLNSLNAAACCNTVDVGELTDTIKQAITGGTDFSKQAKMMALNDFDMADIKKQFWREN